jgi:hypothetical protein
VLDGRSRSADDDLAELATDMLRSPAVEHLRGPDAIALVMIAAGTGELSAGALDVKLGKLQCHPSLRARIDKLLLGRRRPVSSRSSLREIPSAHRVHGRHRLALALRRRARCPPLRPLDIAPSSRLPNIPTGTAATSSA